MQHSQIINVFGSHLGSNLLHRISSSVHRHTLNDEEIYRYISLVMSFKPYRVKYQYLKYIVIPKLWYCDMHTWGGIAQL